MTAPGPGPPVADHTAAFRAAGSAAAQASRRPAVAVPWWLAALLALGVGGAVLVTAWICDDALVTLRNVENLAAGEGFRWNVLDRTLTATHPLWILLLTGVRLITGEPFFTTMGVGVGLATIATYFLARHAGSIAAAFGVVLAAALGSRAFVEFGTGGLENPLVYALLGWYLREWICREGASRLRWLVLVAALLGLARQDVGLLLLPSVVYAMFGLRPGAILRAVWPGVLVFSLWCAFAVVYFGTLLPTPAFGKVVAADVARADLIAQGLRYLLDLVERDPVTALVLATAVVVGIVRPSRTRTPLALGVLLQVAYVVNVGGDFMSGRFFTAAFVVALLASARSFRGLAAWVAGAVLIGASFVNGLPPWARPVPLDGNAAIAHGIGRERDYYAAKWAWWSPARDVPVHGAFGITFADRRRPAVAFFPTAGVAGFLGGPNVHVVEPFLCDPLLMRLPLEDPTDWRIGHFKRRIPEGYFETLASGENRIVDPGLAEYWSHLERALRDPLFAAERWRSIFGLWAGEFDALLADYVANDYLPAPLVQQPMAAFPRDTTPGTPWFDANCVVVREGGLRLRRDMGTASPPARRVLLLLDGIGHGELRFRLRDEVVGTVPFAFQNPFQGGSRWVGFDVPEAAANFDALDVMLATEEPGIATNIYTLPIFAVLGARVSE